MTNAAMTPLRSLALRSRNDGFEPIPPFARSHDERSGCTS
jgi:hypothetical protein